jgi:hypothetical protein
MTREALKLALEALEVFAASYSDGDEAITAIKEALAEPLQPAVPDFKAFKEWAAGEGYDVAYTHDGIKWICLDPMTADLWKTWQAATPLAVQPEQPANKDAEIARLTACLKAANANAEKFEREWYLRGDEIEAMLAQPERDLIRRMQGQIDRLQAALDTLPDRGLSAMAAGKLQPEPVAEIVSDMTGCLSTRWYDEWTPNHGDKLYTSPPKRQPLTDEQMDELIPDDDTPMSLGEAVVKFARAIELHHGIGENT